MEHIVVGFDGTRSAFVAVDWVAERAARTACRVELVTVDAAGTFAEGMSDVAVRDAERRLKDRAPDSAVSFREPPGQMPDALLLSAERADLLVIGAPRSRRLPPAPAGRLALRMAARSQVPTVVVPDDWTQADGSIVVGVDDDDSSSAAVEFAAGEASATAAEVTLVHAWQMPAPTIEGPIALLASPIEVKSAHRRVLDRAFLRISEVDPRIRSAKLLVHGTASAALLAASARASVLVLGTHHRGPVAAMLLGSVGQDAVRLSRVPVCVVPMAAPPT